MKVQKSHKPKLYNSLAFKIGALIVAVEIIIFAAIGIYYTNYFTNELIKRVESQIKTPGVLMNKGVLTFNSIENRSVIGDIVGGDLTEGMIIGLNQRIFFSLDQESIGSRLEDLKPLALRERIFDFTLKEPKVFQEANGRGKFLHYFSPLYSVDGATPRFFVYLKLDTTWIEVQRRELILLFSISSIICIVLTSILIFLFFHRFVFTKLIQLGDASSTLSQGQLELTIPPNIIDSKDEISVLAGSFIKTSEDLKKTTTSIDNLNREIDQRKQAEAKSRSLLESSPDYILNVDRWFKIQYLNRPLGKLNISDTIGKSVFSLINKEVHNVVRNAIAEVFEVGTSAMIDIENKLPNGDSHWLEIRFASIESGGQVTEVMLIITDITTRKKVQEELEATQKELIEKAHRAGMFDIASSNLHNVGNLLNSIVTSLHVIREINRNSHIEKLKKANGILSDILQDTEKIITFNPKSKQLFQYYLQLERKLSDEVDDINHQIERLTQKVQSIDNVVKSQQEYVGFGSITDEYSLVEIINDVLKIHCKELEQNMIRVVINADDDFKIQAQRVKVVHILKNVIKNAIESMKNTPIKSRILTFLVELQDDTVMLRVSDQGIGIEQENITKIFYFGTSSSEEGLGYGLHSSANYMTEMGGRIWAESEGKGKGATFCLEFKSVA